MKKYKSLITFILTVTIGGCAGAGASVLLSMTDPQRLGAQAAEWLAAYSPHLLLGVTALLLAAAVILYIQAKGRLQREGLDDDAVFDAIDHKLSISMALCSLTFIAAFLFFGIFVSALPLYFAAEHFPRPLFILVLATFIIGSFSAIFLQTRLVQASKLLYPDKKGDPLDIKFSKDWLASCDEAEQYVIYRSAYAAYQTAQHAIIFSWLIAVFGALFFGTGMLPIILVTVIWGVLTLRYTTTSMKLSKSHLRG